MIDVQPTHLNEFIHGKRNLNEDLAIKLEKSLGIPYDSWMRLQSGYIYDCKAIDAKNTEEQESLAYENECARILNLRLLYKRLNIAFKSSIDRVRNLKRLFPFDILTSQELMLQIVGFYKHSEKVDMDEKNTLTWLVLNRLNIYQSHIHTEYKEGNAFLAAQEIARLANRCSINRLTIKNCLEKYGIVYLEVEKVEKSPIDAYSTFYNNHPVITATYRYNDLNKLTFDILHELYHIGKHLSETQSAFVSVEGTEYSTDPKEIEANDFARETLIPSDVWDVIMRVGCNHLSPYTIIKTIAAEAKKRGINPTIAVSRYKHDSQWYKTSLYRSPKIL